MIKQLKCFSVLWIVLFTSSCNGRNQPKSIPIKDNDRELLIDKRSNPFNRDARDIVTNGLLDKNGNMWFTTLTEGVYKYDGSTFTNFTTKHINDNV